MKVHCCLLQIGMHDVSHATLCFMPAQTLTPCARFATEELFPLLLFFCVMALFSGPEVEPVYVYKGQDDDRPLLWRPHLNELVGVLGEVRPIEGNIHSEDWEERGAGARRQRGWFERASGRHRQRESMYHRDESLIVPPSGSTNHSDISFCRGILARCAPQSARHRGQPGRTAAHHV